METGNAELANPKSQIENPKYEVAFELAAYDKSRPLIIDPVLEYSTFLGGESFEQALGITIDSGGAAYVVGNTSSTDFPVPGGMFGGLSGGTGTDTFMSKISADGSTLDYSTYLGGDGFELATGVAVDSTGSILITGYTFSTDFPTSNAFQSTLNTGPDAFLTKFDSTGSELSYSTYIGDTVSDTAEEVVVDSSDIAYIVGSTSSPEFPVVNALQGGNGGALDAFLAKFDTAQSGGASLLYSTYFGGTGIDQGFGVAVDPAGNMYLAGYTDSTDLATTNPFQSDNAGSSDAFILALNPAGDTPIYATYFGGTSSDYAQDIVVDSGGKAYLTGFTASTDFPTLLPLQSSLKGPSDAFVNCFNSAGTALDYSTYLGGTDSDSGNAIELDGTGNMYVTGTTYSTDFPLASPLDSVGGDVTAGCEGPCPDAFVSKLNPMGSALIFSTYLGRTEPDNGFDIATDGTRIYVTGDTRNSDFPTTVGAFQEACDTGLDFCNDAFVADISDVILPVATLSPTSKDLGSIGIGFTTAPETVTLTNHGDATLTFTSFNVQVSTTDSTPSPDFASFNDCGVSLVPGATCTITFTMTPTAAGALSAVLRIADNAYSTPTTGVRFITLTGTGTPAPAVSFSAPSLDFGDVNVGTDSTPQTVILTNSGTADLSIVTISAIGFSADFDVSSHTCPIAPAILTPLATCNIDVVYSPIVTGISAADLTVVDDAPGVPHLVSLSGNGVQPLASLSTASIDFGNVLVGSSSGATNVTVTNTGDGILTFGTVGLIGINAGHYTLNNPCPATLAPTEFCNLSAAFAPLVTGPLPAQLSIGTDAPSSPDLVDLTGVGIQPAAGFSTATVSFTTRLVASTSPPQSSRLTNTGTATLNISHIELVGANRFDFSQTNDCGPSLDVGEFCDFFFVFSPGSPGGRTASLEIVDDAPGSPHSINLTGPAINVGVHPLVAFTPPADYTTGTTPFSAATGDLNLDGKNDIVIANHDSSNVTVFLGNGDGSFQTGVNYAVGVDPHGVAIAEVTGDANPDLLVVNEACSVDCTSGSVSLLPGIGDGTFQAASTFGTFFGPSALAVADFNHDLEADLAITEGGGGSGANVAVLLGTGSGSFGAPTTFAVGTPNPASIAARDMNNDGEIDLVTLNATPSTNGSITILEGAGDGTFFAGATYGALDFADGSMGIADFDADGDLDVAVAETGSNTVAIFSNDGGGSFPAETRIPVPGARAVLTTDLNNDSYFDLAVANQSDASVSILLGFGASGFQPRIDVPTSAPSSALAAADLNGDAKADLALAGSLSVLLNTNALFDTTSLDFGNQNVGTTSAEQTVTLKNASNSTSLSVGGITPSGDFVDTNETCTSTPLAPGATCIIDSTFTPAAVGPRNGTLSIGTDAVGSPHIVNLTGIGTQPAVSLSQADINFGSIAVGAFSSVEQITLTNTGTGPLTIASSGLTGANAGQFNLNNGCTGIILAGLTCNMSVKFEPTTAGVANATITIVSDALTSPDVITLTGTGVQPAITLGPAVSFTGNPLNLPCPTKPVTITNTGDVPLDIVSITANGLFSVASHNCPATLAVDASCVANVKFTPLVVGAEDGTLTVTTNPATTGNTVNLTGNGTPACQLLARVRSVTVLRGTDVQDFAIEDAKPSCSPVELALTCSVDNPAACLLNPAIIPPSGASTLKVSNLKRVGGDSLLIDVTSTSEFRTATERVTVRFADFAFTKSPDVATVEAGGVASYSLAIRPVNGLAGNVAFTCSGAPIRSGCAVEPANITLDGASLGQVKVRVTTASRSGAAPLGGLEFRLPDGWARHAVPLLAALLAFLAVAVSRRRVLVAPPFRAAFVAASCARRSVERSSTLQQGRHRGLPLRWAMLSATLLAMLVWASCGGGGGSMNFGSGGTPAGNYTLTVTGTYSSSSGATPGTLANSTTVALRVN